MRYAREALIKNNNKLELRVFDDFTKDLARFYGFFYVNNLDWIETHALTLDQARDRPMLCEVLKIGLHLLNN